VNRRFRGICHFHLHGQEIAKQGTSMQQVTRQCCFSTLKMERYFPPKHRLTYRLYGVISQKMATFITAALRTSYAIDSIESQQTFRKKMSLPYSRLMSNTRTSIKFALNRQQTELLARFSLGLLCSPENGSGVFLPVMSLHSLDYMSFYSTRQNWPTLRSLTQG
jgi:hypothetical protein